MSACNFPNISVTLHNMLLLSTSCKHYCWCWQSLNKLQNQSSSQQYLDENHLLSLEFPEYSVGITSNYMPTIILGRCLLSLMLVKVGARAVILRTSDQLAYFCLSSSCTGNFSSLSFSDRIWEVYISTFLQFLLFCIAKIKHLNYYATKHWWSPKI